MFRIIPLVAVLSASFLNADEDHSHHHGNDAPVERPKVYLDKSPKIVAYQLKRLDNARLLLVETGTDDAKIRSRVSGDPAATGNGAQES